MNNQTNDFAMRLSEIENYICLCDTCEYDALWVDRQNNIEYDALEDIKTLVSQHETDAATIRYLEERATWNDAVVLNLKAMVRLLEKQCGGIGSNNILKDSG